MRTPRTFVDPYWQLEGFGRSKMPGTVIYIHPEGRFHTVRFETGIRECFYGTSYEDTFKWDDLRWIGGDDDGDDESEGAVQHSSEDYIGPVQPAGDGADIQQRDG